MLYEKWYVLFNQPTNNHVFIKMLNQVNIKETVTALHYWAFVLGNHF